MAKQISTGKTVTLSEARLTSLTYTYEDRGDPPVPTLVELRSYDLIDDQGEVYEHKRVGVELADFPGKVDASYWTAVHAEISAAEELA